jgi:hypothetical protein
MCVRGNNEGAASRQGRGKLRGNQRHFDPPIFTQENFLPQLSEDKWSE